MATDQAAPLAGENLLLLFPSSNFFLPDFSLPVAV
jgi:hypothetical protein